MAQYLVVRDRLAKGTKDLADHLVFVTDPKKGALREIANAERIPAVDIPPAVGGRYSVLTPVGILPAALVGMDTQQLLAGAASIAGKCTGDELAKNPAGVFATLQFLADTTQGRHIHVLMPYSDPLRNVADWFVQLWAESLGKHKVKGDRGIGPTPLAALGATDQHSKVQLFMEGPPDKTVTFIAVDQGGIDLTIPKLHGDIKELGYLGGHQLGELLSIEQRATAGALARRGRLNMTMHVDQADAWHLGALFMFLEIATIYAGELYGINPLDQPGVELGKQFTYAMLGRAGRRAGPAGMEPASKTRQQVRRLADLSLRRRGGSFRLPAHHTTNMDKIEALNGLFGAGVSVRRGQVTVAKDGALASPAMDQLARAAVFGDDDEKQHARWLIWELGQAVGVRPASIHDLYLARGRGETHGFTVPAINVRGMAYDTARAIFRTAIALEAGAFILEIARSEIAYTDQRPAEYVAVMLAAALREGFRGPVFIQGDHFQINAKKFAAERRHRGERRQDAGHARRSRPASTTSTSTRRRSSTSTKPTLDEQQRLNYEVGVDILTTVRELQPQKRDDFGWRRDRRGRHGEQHRRRAARVHGRVRRRAAARRRGLVEDQRAIGDVARRGGAGGRLDRRREARPRHARAPLEGGARRVSACRRGAAWGVDAARQRVQQLSKARDGGDPPGDELPEHAVRSPAGRSPRDDLQWLAANAKDERKPNDSDEQFYYKTRKKALGPFKRQLWDLPDATKATLAKAYDEKFTFLFKQLAIGGTAPIVAKFVAAPAIHRLDPTRSDGGDGRAG